MGNNKVRNPFRITAWGLIAVIIIEFLLAGMQHGQNSLLTLKAKAAETEEGVIQIPMDEPVGDYDPEEDGYYAYLKVSYREPGSEIADDHTTAYLPVLCYMDCIYVRPDHLEKIADLSCTVNGDLIMITSGNGLKRMYMTVGEQKCTYEEGISGTSITPVRSFSTYFSETPLRGKESVYVPLNPVLYLLGIKTIIGEQEYWIDQHSEDAMDVLLRMYATADHSTGSAGFGLVPHANLDNGYVMSGAILDHIFGTYTFSSESWKMAIPSPGESKVDVRYYTQVLQDMLSMDTDMAKIMDNAAVKVSKECISAGLFIGGAFAGIDAASTTKFSAETLDLVIKDLEQLSAVESDLASHGVKFVADTNYNELLKKYSKWKKCNDTLEVAGLSLDAMCSIFENACIYANRDTASAVGMTVLLRGEGDEKKPFSGSIFSIEEYKSMIKEYKNFVPDEWVDDLLGKKKKNSEKKDKNETGTTVILQSVDDVVMNITKFAAEKLVGAGLSIGTLCLSLIEAVVDAFNLSPVSKANSLLKAYYSQILLGKIGQKIYELESEKLKYTTVSDQDYQELIALSYLYMRLGKLECDYLINTGNLTEDFEKYCKEQSQELAKMAAILLMNCPRSGDDESVSLPITIKGRIKDAHKSLKIGIPEGAVTPLYMKISGTVLEKTEEEPPVPDAVCDFAAKNNNTGYFGVDEEGKFSVYLPLEEPTDVVNDLSITEDVNIVLKFSSEAVQGDASKSIVFEPKGDIDLGKVYLSGFSWYKYIKDNIVPKRGWASLESSTKNIGQGWSYPEAWDYRAGVLSAQITDLDGNGTEDCALYYLDYTYVYSPGGQIFGNSDPKSTIYVTVLSKNSDDTVTQTEPRQIAYGDGTQFCDYIGGIMEFGGRKYVYFECNSFAYYANGYGTLYTFYSYDGTQLRPDYAVGKTGGGSIEFEYSTVSYDENGEYTGLNVIYDGSPWYNADGTYSKQLLCVDRDWKDFHPGRSALMDNFDPAQAMITGLSSITGLNPGEVTLENADNGYAFGDTYISYRNMDCFSRAFRYNSNGASSGNGGRSVTVTIEDYTDLKLHVDEVVK